MIDGRLSIVGVDLSLSATGVAWIGGVDTLTSDKTGPERLWRIADRLERIVSAARADLVVLEGYSYASANGAHQLGELGGVVRVELWEWDYPYVVVPPSSLKKYATGTGNASKEAVLAAAIRRLGYEGHDHNQADALWLRAMAHDRYGEPLVDMPAANRKALDAVDWPEIGGDS